MRIEADAARGLPNPPSTATPQRSFRAFLSRSASPRLSAAQARTLLGNAWGAVIGILPEPRTSALLTAHWALETDGGRCMPGHNFAGIKAAPGAPGQILATVEGHGATRRELQARFRAYQTPEAGALDYVRLLATRYPDAVAAARAGDSEGFARALAKGGYFTAAPEAYAAGLEWRLANLESGSAERTFAPRPAPGVLAQAALESLLRLLRAPADQS